MPPHLNTTESYQNKSICVALIRGEQSKIWAHHQHPEPCHWPGFSLPTKHKRCVELRFAGAPGRAALPPGLCLPLAGPASPGAPGGGPAVQLGPGQVSSTTSGSSSVKPLHPFMRGEQGQRPPPRPVPPLSSWGVPLTPQVVLRGSPSPTIHPGSSPGSSLGCFWGAKEHQSQHPRGLAHPTQLYWGEGGEWTAGSGARPEPVLGPELGSGLGLVSSNTGIVKRMRIKTGTKARTGIEIRTGPRDPRPHPAPHTAGGAGPSRAPRSSRPYLPIPDVTSDARTHTGRNQEVLPWLRYV